MKMLNLLVLAGLLCLAPSFADAQVTVTDWRGETVDATEGSVDSDGVKIVYHTAGEGPLVIFVHGVASPWHDYRNQIPMLAGKYRVVSMSTRGTDMSDKPSGYEHYATARIADDISAIIEHFGEDRATIVGQDSGGLHAWYFAMTHPEQTERLISLGSVHPGGSHPRTDRQPGSAEGKRVPVGHAGESRGGRGFRRGRAQCSGRPERAAPIWPDCGRKPVSASTPSRSSVSTR